MIINVYPKAPKACCVAMSLIVCLLINMPPSKAYGFNFFHFSNFFKFLNL